ncbi:ankyrin [Piromyces finnis]|uniref:Ankyrin n=1 Tax=Piromyces finnis TaxID=1754191 RepID=A0A1Y1V280_9FUNG|nr:ankyrin [Piromyces finnis]|eukprot:ORX44732.1 ankyrin [Piromyces finnis]
MNVEATKNRIIDIIEKNDFKELEFYISDNNISLKEINNSSFDIFIYSIEHKVSNEIIKYIINQCQYKTFNYSITDGNIHKIPLFSSIANNNFEISDLLLEKEANINCTINNYNIIYYLCKFNLLNQKNLLYTLNHGFNIKFRISSLIYELIENKKNLFLELMFKHYIFDQSFIINFLKIYKNREALSDKELKEAISKEKNKIPVNESMYKKANDKENYEAIKIIFDHDGSDQDIVFCRINKYEILDKAVKMNNYKFVKNILSYKAFNFKNILSEPILQEANRNSNIDIMKLLITSALKTLLKKDKKKETIPTYDIHYFNLILKMAIKLKNLKLVEYLVEDKEFKSTINVNVKDINGELPIVVSIYSGNVEIFEYLMEHGVDCNSKDSNGNPLLSLALSNNPLLVKYLLKKPNININEKDANGNYPLINAINQNDIDNVILLVKYGKDNNIDMDINDGNGNTPLTLSYKLEHFEIFKFLVKYLDIINRKDANGNNILYYTINEEDVNTTKYLINNGVDVNFQDIFGNSALHISIYKKNREIINTLLQNKNIILNTVNKRGESPLITIIKINDYTVKDNEDIIKELIKRGSGVNFIDKAGNSPLFYAVQKRTLPIVKLLIKKGANVNYIIKKNNMSILMYAIELGDVEIVKHLIKSGADINFKNDKDENGDTALTYAIRNRTIDILKFLISNGADTNNINNNGQSIEDINYYCNYTTNWNVYNKISNIIKGYR